MFLIDTIDHFISGDWGADEASDETPKAVRCIRGADINSVNAQSFENVPIRFVADSSTDSKRLQAGDIIIEKSGGSPTQSTGRVAFISQKCIDRFQDVVCSNFCAAFRVKEDWNPKYIFYYIQLVYNNGIFFNFEGKTSGLRNLQLENAFKSIPIKHIDRPIQDKVVDVLDSIENKIALSNEINRNLEQVARQLYDHWFVQFDFPNHEGKPYKSSGGEMVWNEALKRNIPKGWSNASLSEIANITMGQSPDGSSYNDIGEGCLFYQGSTDFGIRFPKVRQYTTAPSRYARKGDILMSVRAPVGTLNIANNDCCIGRGLAALNSKIGSITHLYCVMCDLKAVFDQQNSVGTTFGSITKDTLYGLAVSLPTKDLVESFEKICQPIFDEQMRIGEQAVELQRLRDELLPMLLNGQVNCDLYYIEGEVSPLIIYSNER